MKNTIEKLNKKRIKIFKKNLVFQCLMNFLRVPFQQIVKHQL